MSAPILGQTVDILRNHSARMKSSLGMSSAHGLETMTPGQSPHNLTPYLHKVRTSDIMEYLDGGCNKTPAEDSHRCTVQRFARRLLRRRSFDVVMGLVIVLNLIVMIIETDRVAMDDETSGGSLYWTEVFGFAVLILFVFELSLRLIALGCLFWIDSWNVFDFIIVIVDCTFSVIGLLAGSTFPVSILRIFRLAKLARVFKVLRVFPELRLLLAGLISTISAIFWGTVLLFFFMLIWAMVGVLFIHPLNKKIDYGSCDRCSRAYSSVWQATLTYWQTIVTGDSWGQATVPLIETYPGTAVFFIAVYLSVGMAVTNLILGVVVNVAQQAQDALAEEDHTDKALKQLFKHTHLLELCKNMDTDGDGNLTRDEVFSAFDAPGDFHDTISAFGIAREDFDIAWTILDSHKKGYASYKELVSFISSLKTTDPMFQLSYIKYYITLLREGLLANITETVDIGQRLQDDMHEIEMREEQILKDERLLRDGQFELLKTTRHNSEMIETISMQHETARQCSHAKGAQGSNAHTESAISQGKVGLFGSTQGTSNIMLDTYNLTPNADMACDVKLPRGEDATLTEFNHLRIDVGMMHSELKSILKHMEYKLDQHISNISAMDLSSTNPPRTSDLLVMPSRRSFTKYSPNCCNVPATQVVVQ